MNYISTRGHSPALSFSQTILQGLAPDGGLYVPEKFPYFTPKLTLSFSHEDLGQLALTVLDPWLQSDPLHSFLPEICQQAFTFPTPLVFLNKNTAILELFHGPTAAFKDMGARFLAACLARTPSSHTRVILVATSGDTGGAVASAFFQKMGFQVVILYPQGKVSSLQELQLTTWGENIHALAVEGDFDDCQKMVKAVFSCTQANLLSANSINLGRLLPQTLYYAQTSILYFLRTGQKPGFIIPTGNMGNTLAAIWAKKMGFPIREIVCATNKNRPLVDYLQTGIWQPQATLSTLANAMDVGNPSNMERLLYLYSQIDSLRQEIQAFSVNDEEIQKAIHRVKSEWNKIICPHTATAASVLTQLPEKHWILVATAHPAKFKSIVDPLVGEATELPDSLKQILARPGHHTKIEPQTTHLTDYLKKFVFQ